MEKNLENLTKQNKNVSDLKFLNQNKCFFLAKTRNYKMETKISKIRKCESVSDDSFESVFVG